MEYETLRSFADTWGLVYLVSMFVIVIAIALWPTRAAQQSYDKASRIPLEEDNE